jgi:hypothetical protein
MGPVPETGRSETLTAKEARKSTVLQGKTPRLSGVPGHRRD